MKYVIFTDVHGNSLKPLEKRLEHYGRKSNLRLICMSDFDDADAIKEARDLIESYNGIIVPGNHDEMLYRKFVDFDSGTFRNGTNAFGYALKLHKDKEALDYLASILYGNNAKNMKNALRQQSRLIPIIGEQSDNDDVQLSNAIIVHGGLDGSLCSEDYINRGIEKLWYRIYVNELWQKHAEQNFLKMDEMGCNIMIRGMTICKLMPIKGKMEK